MIIQTHLPPLHLIDPSFEWSYQYIIIAALSYRPYTLFWSCIPLPIRLPHDINNLPVNNICCPYDLLYIHLLSISCDTFSILSLLLQNLCIIFPLVAPPHYLHIGIVPLDCFNLYSYHIKVAPPLFSLFTVLNMPGDIVALSPDDLSSTYIDYISRKYSVIIVIGHK